MRLFTKRVCCPLVLLLIPYSLNAQAGAKRKPASSPREFVAGFYRWYVPHAVSDNAPLGWSIILRHKKTAVFSPQLAQLLQADQAAQHKCNEIVGLDFDPFLAAQDPPDRYEVGRISHEGRDYRAAIYSVQAGKRSEKTDLRAEFSEGEGHWFFVNFYYPDGSNLLNILMSPKPKCSAADPPARVPTSRNKLHHPTNIPRSLH